MDACSPSVYHKNRITMYDISNLMLDADIGYKLLVYSCLFSDDW